MLMLSQDYKRRIGIDETTRHATAEADAMFSKWIPTLASLLKDIDKPTEQGNQRRHSESEVVNGQQFDLSSGRINQQHAIHKHG